VLAVISLSFARSPVVTWPIPSSKRISSRVRVLRESLRLSINVPIRNVQLKKPAMVQGDPPNEQPSDGNATVPVCRFNLKGVREHMMIPSFSCIPSHLDVLMSEVSVLQHPPYEHDRFITCAILILALPTVLSFFACIPALLYGCAVLRTSSRPFQNPEVRFAARFYFSFRSIGRTDRATRL
jgi:hypothetical protein